MCVWFCCLLLLIVFPRVSVLCVCVWRMGMREFIQCYSLSSVLSLRTGNESRFLLKGFMFACIRLLGALRIQDHFQLNSWLENSEATQAGWIGTPNWWEGCHVAIVLRKCFCPWISCAIIQNRQFSYSPLMTVRWLLISNSPCHLGWGPLGPQLHRRVFY